MTFFDNVSFRLVLFCLIAFTVSHAQTATVAGFRASRILNSYPNRQFPQPHYWSATAQNISAKFPGTVPGGIWIVSLYINNGTTQLNFPSGGIVLPNINFISTDQNEAYLNHFDTTGIKVWLQVEPGDANIYTLIHIVLNRYKHHPSVVGFGVDAEWYRNNAKVTDSAAQRWDEKVRSIDTNYTLFLKHYGQSWMPPSYRGKIMFVDDSQDFSFASNPFNYMVNEFKSWGAKFSPNVSAFQYGYPKDSVWWKSYADPVKTIGDALISNIPTTRGLFWVDFTIAKIFPITLVRDESTVPAAIHLRQNYPNPFNPATTISFVVPAGGSDNAVFLQIYDLMGREIAAPVHGRCAPGEHSVRFDGTPFPSGVYFYRLISGNSILTQRMLLLK
jgi:hypothetical protein